MSWLLFKRGMGKLYLCKGKMPSTPSGTSVVAGKWEAHNQTSSDSKGPWPNGIYRYDGHNPHQEAGLGPACYAYKFGCEGILYFKFTDGSRTYMGVHAGRAISPNAVGGLTRGCIRTSSEAMRAIQNHHANDRLEALSVAD